MWVAVLAYLLYFTQPGVIQSASAVLHQTRIYAPVEIFNGEVLMGQSPWVSDHLLMENYISSMASYRSHKINNDATTSVHSFAGAQSPSRISPRTTPNATVTRVTSTCYITYTTCMKLGK